MSGYSGTSDAAIPSTLRVTVTIAPAQIATLFSLPVTLVAAAGVGKVLIPTYIHVFKQAGTGWTVGTPGQLAVGWTGGGGNHSFAQFNQATTQTFFGAASDFWIAEAGKGSSNSFGDVGDNNIENQAVMIHLTTADISGGTGNLIVDLWYRVWGTSTVFP